MSVTYKHEKIGPRKAQQLLNANVINNRKLRRTKIAQLARDMASGRWVSETGETIKITADGEFLDGQNRMAAIIEAGVTIELDVAYGVSKKAMAVIDTGSARTFSDSLLINDDGVEVMKNRFVVAAVARRVLLWESGFKAVSTQRVGGGRTRVIRPTHTEMLERVDRDRSQFIASATRGVDLKAALGTPPTTPGVAHFLFSQLDKDHAETFFGQVLTGAELPYDHPAMALRRRLLKLKLDKWSREDIDYTLSSWIYAWNHFRKDELIKRWPGYDMTTKEHFPDPI